MYADLVILDTGEIIWDSLDEFTPDQSDAGIVTSMHFASQQPWNLVITHVEAGLTYVCLGNIVPSHIDEPLRSFWVSAGHCEYYDHPPM